MPKNYQPTASDKIRAARQRRQRQRAEAARVDAIVSRRLTNDIRAMMRDNRMKGV